MNAYKSKLHEKDQIIRDNCDILERERKFREFIEQKKQNVKDAEVNTEADLELIEQDNLNLRA